MSNAIVMATTGIGAMLMPLIGKIVFAIIVYLVGKWLIGKVLVMLEKSKRFTELDGAVGMNSGIFNNPFMIWGRYRKRFFRYSLPISFQFHHTQMDGAHAGRFLENLQTEIHRLR